MANDSEGSAPSRGGAGGTLVGGAAARLITILIVNLALAMTAVIYAQLRGGKLPSLNAETLSLGLLPISAAMGLVLACRRIDFSLPIVLVLALDLQGNRGFFSGDTFLRLVVVCGVCGAVGLVSATVTWYGRVSSALWTGILAFGLWLVIGVLKIEGAGPGTWPWIWAVPISVGLLAAGAAVLGLTGLVVLPSSPPIIRSGSGGFAGLVGAWILAGAAVALASQSNVAQVTPQALQAAYPQMLAAGALGGAFILRGKWGALTAVLLTCVGHLTSSFAWSTNLGNSTADILVPALAPLAAIPLYLIMDWLIRRHTGESSPTGLLA